MSDRDYRDDSDYESKHGEKTAKLVTADELRQKVEGLKNGKGLDNVDLKLDVDEDGNTSILGLKVSSSIAPVLRTGIASIKALMIKNSDKLFSASVGVATRLGMKTPAANKLGAIVEDTGRWLMVGGDQIYNLVHLSTTYSKKRAELFQEFEPVIHATGANYRNNEVIKAAFEDVHRDWVTDMKMMAADIPMMAATVALAWEGQVDARKRRSMVTGDDSVLSQNIDAMIAEETKHVTAQVESNSRLEKILDEKRIEYVKANRGKKKDYSGRPISDSAIARDFDDTVGERVRNNFEERQNAQFKNHDERDGKKNSKNDGMFVMAVPVLGLAGEVLKNNFETSAEKHRKRANSWEMIKHLRNEVERQYDNPSGKGVSEPKSADEIMVSQAGDKGGADSTLKQYITEIFQQHERDRNPGKLFKDKKGHVINPLGESMVEQLQGPIDQIAEAIASRRIDASALVILVGENKIIKHKGSERHFATAKEVESAINALAPVLNTSEKIRVDEFFANFADPALAEGTLKKTLDELKGDDKAMFASLFPDNILRRAGVKQKDIVELHKQAHENLYNFVAASVLALAETAEKNPDQLKKAGLCDEDMHNIAEMAEKIRSEDFKSLQTAVDSHSSIVNAVRTELLNKFTAGNGMTSWTERISKSKELQLGPKDADAVPQLAASAVERETTRRGKESEALAPGGPA